MLSRVPQVRIDLVEFLYFIIPTDIGLHYTDGGQVFLDDPVDQIDGALHHAVEGPHMADDQEQQDAQHRGSHKEHQGQLRINIEGSHHGCQHHHRGTEPRPHAR